MTTINKKRIAKNTFMLYFRMIIVMVVSLYTSRIFLAILGNEDFGIYNVVGGIIGLFAFITNSFGTVTQRYLNTYIGKGNAHELKKVFASCLSVHLGIALIYVILGETIGLWFVQNKLVIPYDRMYAALWVFQISIVSIVISLFTMPFQSAMISHEKISVYSYYSIIDITLKLVILYLLKIATYDKLIVYALLMLAVNLISNLFCIVYCLIKFPECRIRINLNKSLIKEITSFSGWMTFSTFCLMLSVQGVSILMNLFGGPIANAARAVAVQIQTAVQGFVTNFTVAANPQMIQSYSSGNIKDSMNLSCNVGKLSFYLMSVIVTPIIFNIDYILNLWLVNPPEFTSIFTQLLLIEMTFRTFHDPIGLLVQASGKIKIYQLIIGVLFGVIFICTYISYKLGAPLYVTYLWGIIIAVSGTIIRVWYAKKLLDYPFHFFIINIFSKACVFAFLLCGVYYLKQYIIPVTDTFNQFIVQSLLIEAILIIFIWFFALTKDNKIFIYTRIRKIRGNHGNL